MTIIEKVMSFNGPSLAVNLMEGQSTETADTASVHESMPACLPHFVFVLKMS